MNSTFLLLADIRAELEKAFKHMVFRAKTEHSMPEAHRPPAVVIGHVPPKRSVPTSAATVQDDSEPPFILVRSLDGEFGQRDKHNAAVHQVKVGIMCCVYSDESYSEVQAGYHDIMNMVDTVLLTLNSKDYWADRHWSRELPATWTTGLGKALDIYAAGAHWHPYYGAAVIGTFYAASPHLPRVAEVDAHEPPRRVG